MAYRAKTESKEIPSMEQNQSTYKNTHTNHQSEPQKYTPNIKYTKLEFKVCVLS